MRSNIQSVWPPTAFYKNGISYVFKRPVGRSSNEIQLRFSYHAASWTKAHWDIAKVEWHLGVLYWYVRLHRRLHVQTCQYSPSAASCELEELIKISAKIVSHGRCVASQIAETPN